MSGTVPATGDRAMVVARALADARGPVSGQALASETGISRAAIRKHVQRLVAAGAVVDARAGVGYEMREPPSRPDQLGIALYAGRTALPRAERLGRRVIWQESVPSTNDLAVEYGRRGEPEGVTVTADRQTAGRGRRGRTWESPRGGLYMSLVLRPPLAPADLTALGLVVSLAACRALDALGLAGTVLKWPNDVMLGGRKLAGVLVEASADIERVAWAVVGIGMNVRDGMPSRAALAAAVLDALEPLLDRLYREGPAPLMREVEARCDTIGRDVRVVQADGSIRSGRALGLDDNGSLRLLEAVAGRPGSATRPPATGDAGAGSGREIVLSSGDVEQLRVPD